MALLTSLVAAYNLDESSGNAADSSGNGYTLTNSGSTPYVSGKIANAIDFGTANTTKQLRTTNTMGINGDAVSISIWVKLNTEIATGANSFVNQVNTSTQVGYYIDYNYNSGTRGLRFYRFKWGIGTNEFTHNITLGTSNWTHIVLTYDGTTMRGYVNGTATTTVAASGNGLSGGTDGFGIGSYNAGAYASNTTDMTYVWNREITQAEVTQLYNTGSGLQYPFTAAVSNSRFLMFMQ